MILADGPLPDPTDSNAVIGWICLALVSGGLAGIGWLVRWLAAKLEKQERRNDFQAKVRALEQVGVMSAINSMQRQDLAHQYSMAGILDEETKDGMCQKMCEMYASLQKPLDLTSQRLQKCADDISRALAADPPR